ncbi:hypothetical protein AAHA92_07480 [Salvia divinorum]|uniref:Uncharacterized protein n=1 Tax=Salvia divinorum TaxID=28513 RepID=A0ABD1I945_SALDI
MKEVICKLTKILRWIKAPCYIREHKDMSEKKMIARRGTTEPVQSEALSYPRASSYTWFVLRSLVTFSSQLLKNV